MEIGFPAYRYYIEVRIGVYHPDETQSIPQFPYIAESPFDCRVSVLVTYCCERISPQV